MEGARRARRWHRPDLGLVVGFDQRARAPGSRIEFEGDFLAGLIIYHRPPTVEALTLMTALHDLEPYSATTLEELRNLQRLSEIFADLIVAWNVEDNGVQVPPSASAYLALDHVFVLATTKAWVRLTIGLPQLAEPPVEPAEPVFDETQIPMEPLAS